jgi:hypothetical protein
MAFSGMTHWNAGFSPYVILTRESYGDTRKKEMGGSRINRHESSRVKHFSDWIALKVEPPYYSKAHWIAYGSLLLGWSVLCLPLVCRYLTHS